MHNVKSQHFFVEHAIAIEKNSNGKKKFDAIDPNVLRLQEWVKDS